jgi:hypothetical protein
LLHCDGMCILEMQAVSDPLTEKVGRGRNPLADLGGD